MPSVPNSSTLSAPPLKPSYAGQLDPRKLDQLKPVPPAQLTRIVASVRRNLRRGLLAPKPAPTP